MKRNFLFFIIILFTSPLIAQVSLPVTLNFTSNAAAAWADGIVQDGDGGSSKISLASSFYKLVIEKSNGHKTGLLFIKQ